MPDLPLVVQGGAVGLCAYCLWIIYKMQNGQRQSFISALDRNTKAMTDFTEAIAILSERITRIK